MFNNFLNREKDTFFTLEDTENVKKGILVLESEYFEIIKIILEEDLDEREREYEIEEQLENRIINYEAVDYIEKEIFLRKIDEIEENLIILIKREKIYEIADKIREKGIALKGIIPVFLLKYLSNEEKKDEIFLDIGMGRTSVVVFKDNKLRDIVTIDIEKGEGLYSQEEFDELLERIVFSIEEENFDNIEKIEKEKNDNIEFYYSLSALEMKKIILKSKNIICGCGQSINELLYLKANFFPIVIADNQEKNVAFLYKNKIVGEVLRYNKSFFEIESILRKFMFQKNEVYNLIDGKGIKRIMKLFLI